MKTSTLMETTAELHSDYHAFNYSFIIFSIVIVLSLVGNILVVVISVFCVRLRSLTSVFILNLALSDLLFTVGLVFRVCELIRVLPPMDEMYKVVSFFLSAGYYSSIVFLVLMTVQHYMAVVRLQSGWKKGRWVTHVVICAWTISILASLPVVIQIVPHPYLGLCLYHNIIACLAITYKENIIFVGAFLFICKSPPNQRDRSTGLTFILVATFFIFWAPYNTVNFLYTLTYYQMCSTQVFKCLDYASYICHVLAYTRCCLNPVIYGLFGLIFRKTAQNIFRRRAALNSEQRAN